MSDPTRTQLLEAAARIYSEAGFRGATTRRIADEAGVNEVTLFRLFGSKGALIAEAVRAVPGFTLTPSEVETNLVWFEVDSRRHGPPQAVTKKLYAMKAS